LEVAAFNGNRAGVRRVGRFFYFLAGRVGYKLYRDGMVGLIDPFDHVAFFGGQVYLAAAIFDVDCNGVLSGSTGYKAANQKSAEAYRCESPRFESHLE
jgi:hypothetical protein